MILLLLFTIIRTTAAAPILGVISSTPLTQQTTNQTGLFLDPSIQNLTSLLDLSQPRRSGYRYDVPGTNTWLLFHFHGARKIDHDALVQSLFSGMDEVGNDIKFFGAATHVNENKGPFNEYTRGCMFTISSTLNPNKVRRMTYSMRMDTLRGIYQVLVKAKREEAAEFIIYHEGLGLVGVGTIDQERKTRQIV